MKELQSNQEEIQLSGINTLEQDFSSNSEADSYPAEYTANYENGYDTYGSNVDGTAISPQQEETELTANNQTARVHTYNKKNAFKLQDAKGTPLVAEGIGDILVREGIEVVHLKNTVVVGEETYQEIIVWLNGVYYKGFIPQGAIEGADENNKIKSKDVLNAFLNDLEHGVFRAEKRMEYESRGRFEGMGLDNTFLDKYEKDTKENNAQFFKLKDEVLEMLQAIRDKELKVSARQLKKLQKKEAAFSELSKKEPVKALGEVSERIFGHYNSTQKQEPDEVGSETEGKTAEDVIALVPFSTEWFAKNTWLKEHFDSYWNSLGIGWNDRSGEFRAIKGDKELKDALVHLKENLKELPEGIEKDWISALDLSKKELYVFISSQTFKFDGNTLFAEGIPVKQQFGNIMIAPLQTVTTHEMNMSGGLEMMGDTHITPEESSAVYNNMDGVDVNELQMEDPTKVDDLYQSDSYLELMNINYILKELKSMK
jgi:hypothetical protein